MALLSDEIDVCHALLTAAGVPKTDVWTNGQSRSLPLQERISLLVTRCHSVEGQMERRTADWEQAKEICRRAERRVEALAAACKRVEVFFQWENMLGQENRAASLLDTLDTLRAAQM